MVVQLPPCAIGRIVNLKWVPKYFGELDPKFPWENVMRIITGWSLGRILAGMAR